MEVTSDLDRLQDGGRWAVAVGFEGQTVLARFRDWRRVQMPEDPWPALRGRWNTSMDEAAYTAGVRAVQEHIATGWVYQVNLCRILSVPCEAAGLTGLYDRLKVMEATFGGLLELPDHGVHIASASPERFLSRRGTMISSSPIKGTADHPDRFLPKDRAENIMIVDLVRNDLGRVARTGSVAVRQLLAVEPYPGLYHLVSTVTADLDGVTWPPIFDATFPPGSVSGAPKHSALSVIRQIEPCERQWYCGAFGWVDADEQRADLAVAIRTFWLSEGMLKFGTGAGITWGSDPAGEWRETQLKAQRLIEIAAPGSGG
jgi:para-aminobenzoate synthetase component 1